MLEKHGIAWDMMHGSDGENVVDDPKKAFLALPALQQHILGQDDGKKRWGQVVRCGHIRIARSRCGG